MLKVSQLKTIYRFMSVYNENPRIPLKTLHKRYSPYKTVKSTRDLLNKAQDTQVFIGPRLFLNANLDVELYDREELSMTDAFERWDQIILEPSVRYAILLGGAQTLLLFKRGANILTYARSIQPSFPLKKEIHEIDPAERGKIPPDPYPKNWDELDWEVYEYAKHLCFSYIKIGKKLGVSAQTVRNRFLKILGECKSWNSFFPKGLQSYYHAFLSFSTDYEIGLEKELEKLDRTTFIYKFRDIILLYCALDDYKGIQKFCKMENEGIIRGLRVSNPIQWFKPDVLL